MSGRFFQSYDSVIHQLPFLDVVNFGEMVKHHNNIKFDFKIVNCNIKK